MILLDKDANDLLMQFDTARKADGLAGQPFESCPESQVVTLNPLRE